MRRPVIVLAALLLTLWTPSAAGAEPVPEANITKSVRTLTPRVLDIDLSKAVVPLEEEQTEGAQVTVRISADVLFDFNKATLTDAARRRITALAPRLRDARGTIQVSGHSDSVGDPGYNRALSEKRAEAVKAELQAALGTANLQVAAKGFGESKPVAPNEIAGKDNPAGRAKNRRVEITYEKG